MKARNILSACFHTIRSKSRFILAALLLIAAFYDGVNLWAVSTVYENTGNIPVAVVNADRPAHIGSRTISIGDELVETLQSKGGLGWHFVGEKEADEGLVAGRYYAAFIIPADFSQKIASIATGELQKPSIIYKVNNKLSSFAGKVTGSAKNNLVDEINASFTATVSRAVGESLDEVGSKLEGKADKVLALKRLVIVLDENMDTVTGALDQLKNQSDDMETVFGMLQAIVPALNSVNETTERINQANIAHTGASEQNDSVRLILDDLSGQAERVDQLTGALAGGGQPDTAASIERALDSMIASLDSVDAILVRLGSPSRAQNAGDAASDLDNLSTSLGQLQRALDDLQKLSAVLRPSGGKLTADASARIDAMRTTLQGLDTTLSGLSARLAALGQAFPSAPLTGLVEALDGMTGEIDQLVGQLDALKSLALPEKLADKLDQLDARTEELNSSIANARKKMDAASAYFGQVNTDFAATKKRIDSMLASIHAVQDNLREEKSRVGALREMHDSADAAKTKALDGIRTRQEQTRNSLKAIRSDYEDRIQPSLERIRDNEVALGGINSAGSANRQESIRQLNALLGLMQSGSGEIAATADSLKGLLLASREELHTLATRLKSVDDSDLAGLVGVLSTGAIAAAEQFASPIEVDSTVLYEIPNNVSNMAALYTTISLWFGSYLFAAGLKVSSEEETLLARFGLRERYLGRMLSQIVLSLCQAVPILLTNLVILRIYVVSVPLFVMYSLFVSLVFSVILFTLVEIFGTIGKAFCSVYMILQLTGSGGSFPIQLEPPILQSMHAVLPYTYAVNGLREAVAGPDALRVLMSAGALALLGLVFLVFGLAANQFFVGNVQRYTKSFRESGIGQ